MPSELDYRRAFKDITVSIDLGSSILQGIYDLYSTSESSTERDRIHTACPECANNGDAVQTNQVYVCHNGHGPFKPAELLRGTYVNKQFTVIGTSDELREVRGTKTSQKEMSLRVHLADEVMARSLPTGTSYVMRPSKNNPLYPVLLHLLDDEGFILGEDGRKRVLIGEVSLRSEQIIWLRKWQGNLVVQPLTRPNMTRSFPAEDIAANDRLLSVAEQAVLHNTVSFTEEMYESQADKRVEEFIARRAEGGMPEVSTPDTPEDSVDDLIASLEAAVKTKPEKKTRRKAS